MNRFQVKLGHLSNYIRNFSPIKSIAIMERIVNHPILTIPQEGEHTFLFNGKPVTGMKGFTIAAALHVAGCHVLSLILYWIIRYFMFCMVFCVVSVFVFDL